MASATFTLRAVDQTRAAFASVQNSLQKIGGTAKEISRNITTFFGFRAAIAGVQRLDAAMKEAEKSGTKIGLTQEEVDNLTVATNLYDKAVQNIQITIGKATSMVAKLFGQNADAAEATNIRLANAKPELDDIHEKLVRQIVDNDLIGETDDRIYQSVVNQVDALRYKFKMQTDVVKKAQTELDLAGAIGDQRRFEQKFYEDQNDAIEQRRNLERQIKETVGIESDIIARSNKLLEDRANFAAAMRNVEATGIEGEMQRNDLRKQYNKTTAELIPLLQERYQLERQIGETVASSFQNAIFEGGKFSDLLRSLIKQILEMIFYQTVTRKLAGYISSALIGNPLADITFGALQTKGFALGGPVGPGKPIMVGERGPEMFVPNSSGVIVPNHKSGTAIEDKGPTINISYNIAAGVSRSELAPILESERRRLKAEIPDMVRRGGAYRAAFA
jgi:hypothetical protein